MRMNTRGHMVYRSEREAATYARNAGFRVDQELNGEIVASRPDMQSSFTLQRVSKGPNGIDYMWYRPFSAANYTG